MIENKSKILNIDVDKDIFDFGFTTMSASDYVPSKEKIAVDNKNKTYRSTCIQYYDTIQLMYKMIRPLIVNLSQNPEQELIKWPNRAERLKLFDEKLRSIMPQQTFTDLEKTLK